MNFYSGFRLGLWAAGCIALAACGNADEAALPPVQSLQDQAVEPLAPALSAEEQALSGSVTAIMSAFDGHAGVAIHDVQRVRTVQYKGGQLFPQQSLSKLWVALAALRKVDEGTFDLSERVTIMRSDLTLFHQPVRKIVLARGAFHTNYADLLRRAITESDNTANDMLLKRVGGPNGVRNALNDTGLADIKFGPGEREMQSALAGLEWDPSFSFGKRFFEVRKTVPAAERKVAFDNYVANPVDGATPIAIAEALAKLSRGELLKPATTAAFLDLLDQVKSGPNRLKGGVPEGWSIGHKTGTGQVLDIVPPGVIGAQTGYNDVGLLTAPDGRRYAIAVLIGRTRTPVPERMAMMHAIVRATIVYHYQAKGMAVPAGMLPEPEPETAEGTEPL